MSSTTIETQIRAYSHLRALEAGAQSLEELLDSMKRGCMHRGPGAAGELAAATAEVRSHLDSLGDLVAELDGLLQTGSGGAPVPERRQEERQPTGLRGATDVLSVADLVGFLSSLKKTGTLTLRSADSMLVFEFQDGAIVHAATNLADPELRLGTILVAQNTISEGQLQDGLQTSARENQMLGTHLVRSQTVSAPDLRSALEAQVRGIFDAAFTLQHARFTFLEGGLSKIADRVNLSTMQLLLESARQDDERRRGQQASPAARALDTILGG